jgi:hypothetical protein
VNFILDLEFSVVELLIDIRGWLAVYFNV